MIDAVAGQRLQLLASTASGNTIGLNLTDGAGNYITSDFDEPASVSYTVPTSGQYFAEVNFGNPNNSGSFTLALTCTTSSPPPPATCQFTATLKAGDTVSGQLTSADAACGDSKTYLKAYKIVMNEGDAISVQYSATYPAFIEISGPDRSGAYRFSNTNLATMAYIAPATGNVTIWVGSNTASPATGSFTLSVSPVPISGCGKPRAVRH